MPGANSGLLGVTGGSFFSPCPLCPRPSPLPSPHFALPPLLILASVPSSQSCLALSPLVILFCPLPSICSPSRSILQAILASRPLLPNAKPGKADCDAPALRREATAYESLGIQDLPIIAGLNVSFFRCCNKSPCTPAWWGGGGQQTQNRKRKKKMGNHSEAACHDPPLTSTSPSKIPRFPPT